MLRFTIYLVTFFILANSVSCLNISQQKNSGKKNDTAQSITNNFFKQILVLTEFKQVQEHADSINRISKIQIKVSIEIIDSSYLEEDRGKGISLGSIIEKFSYGERTIYTIKFDKNRKKIVSIKKEENQFELSNLAEQEDIPLPQKHN